ncbi:MAG: zinc ribbon domain-containing protein [Candidatus Thorarchaeota archaeon]|nr:MAG: zinc ribbon domain-containing protein [Candidatus Thorarchaeota archaeon]
MRRTLPHLLVFVSLTCLLCSGILLPAQAAVPVGWSGDSNLAFLLEVNGVNAVDSDAANPIPVDLAEDLNFTMDVYADTNLTILSYAFTMSYLYIPIISQVEDLGVFVHGNTTILGFIDESISLASLQSSGLGLISGTITGSFSFIYNITSGTKTTVSENFVLQIGPGGAASILSVSGLITVGFTAMSIFSLIMAMDEFQRGIFAARKMRGAKRGSDVGIFPREVVLRRKPKKKGGESIDKAELTRRVSDAAKNSWDSKRCPKCGKKWKKDAQNCGKCGIDSGNAITFFSENIAEYAPKALIVIKPKSKVTVGQLGKKLKLKPDKAGALAAALVDMGALQTKSVKVPLKKVAFSGMTLAGSYWSWMQMVSGATPDWVTIILSTTAGLVVSVLIGYFMNFLARVPELGYE